MPKEKDLDCTQCHEFCRINGRPACTDIPRHMSQKVNNCEPFASYIDPFRASSVADRSLYFVLGTKKVRTI